MNPMFTIPELLAPAGSMAALHAAVTTGADAVYLGLGSFNARRNASNFTLDEFSSACDYAHLRGVRIYVTMNTIVLQRELADALDLAKKAYERGADAFIVQDIGFAAALKQEIPQAELHISTQMNIHSKYGLEASSKLQAERVTLARELSLVEIAHLCKRADSLGMQIEVFAHGALCVCYSGQCLMSSMIGARSANRGLCAQACRLPYKLLDVRGTTPNELRTPGEFLLSPKDLCSIDHIDQLAEAGVASLKIEGRMKSPEYVASVTQVYREALDCLLDGEPFSKEVAKRKLGSVFSRGFAPGYLEGESGSDLMGFSRPNNRGQFAGRVRSADAKSIVVDNEIPLRSGDVIEFWSTRGNCTVTLTDQVKFKGSVITIPVIGDRMAKDTRNIRKGDRAFRVRSADSAFQDSEYEPRIGVDCKASLRIGEPLRIEFSTASSMSDGGDTESQAANRRVSACAFGEVVEPARTKPVNAEDVISHIDRMGSTPFKLESCEVELDEDAGIGFSQIHHCRQDALEKLADKILAPWHDREPLGSKLSSSALFADASESDGSLWKGAPNSRIRICALATNPLCARAAKRAGAEDIYVPALNMKRGFSQTEGMLDYDISQANFPKRCIPFISAIDHDRKDGMGMSLGAREQSLPFDPWDYVDEGKPVLVDSIGGVDRACDIGAVVEVGSHIPITNRSSVLVAQAFGAKRVWLSPELNIAQIADITKASDMSFGIHVYGAQELMVTEHCMLTSMGGCSQDCDQCQRRRGKYALEDRKGYAFPYVSDSLGRGHIYNSVRVDAIPDMADLVAAGVDSFMVDCTLMSTEQTAQAIGRARKAAELIVAGAKDASSLAMERQGKSTSGHLHRGVM